MGKKPKPFKKFEEPVINDDALDDEITSDEEEDNSGIEEMDFEDEEEFEQEDEDQEPMDQEDSEEQEGDKFGFDEDEEYEEEVFEKDDDDIFEYEGDKGKVEEFITQKPEVKLTEAEKKKKDIEDAQKAIKKRKSLVHRKLAEIGCKNRRLELVLR